MAKGGIISAIHQGSLVNGNKVSTAVELRTKLSECRVGDTVEVTIMRNGAAESRQVTLAEVPKGY